MKSPFFIVGPTAVGKTRLAVALAGWSGAEIVSADAFQIYEGLPLLTVKPTTDQLGRVAHHLVGCIPLCQAYSVALYLDAARAVIAKIQERGRPVIVVGGNGLYVKALTHGLADLPTAQPELRAELEASELPDLLGLLRSLDPTSAAAIDGRNKRRLIRALEVCLVTGRPFSDFRTEWATSSPTTRSHGVLLCRDRVDIVQRIEQRTVAMFRDGVVEEVRAINDAVLSATSERILGLVQIRALLAGQMGITACQEKLQIATRQYAKRQVTWFKGEDGFEPLNLTNLPHEQEPLEFVKRCFEAWHSAHQTTR